jgi:hypothetical protein
LSFKAKSSCDATQLTQDQKIAKKIIVAPSGEIVSPKNTYEKLGIQMETYEFCEKQSLVMDINYGQEMNNYDFFLAKIHTMVTKQSPV